MENHTTAPAARGKCTPSAACGGVSPRESVSRDFQVALLPYKSRSLATPEGEILATLCLAMLMRINAERRADFPHRGGKGTGFVGSPWATENPVTCFPLGEVPPQAGIEVYFQRAAGPIVQVFAAVGSTAAAGGRRLLPQEGAAR